MRKQRERRKKQTSFFFGVHFFLAEALLLISDSEIYIGDIIVLKQITDDDNIMGRPKYIQSATKLAMDCIS
jgi:hypothetical protein